MSAAAPGTYVYLKYGVARRSGDVILDRRKEERRQRPDRLRAELCRVLSTGFVGCDSAASGTTRMLPLTRVMNARRSITGRSTPPAGRSAPARRPSPAR